MEESTCSALKCEAVNWICTSHQFASLWIPMILLQDSRSVRCPQVTDHLGCTLLHSCYTAYDICIWIVHCIWLVWLQSRLSRPGLYRSHRPHFRHCGSALGSEAPGQATWPSASSAAKCVQWHPTMSYKERRSSVASTKFTSSFFNIR